MASKQAGPLYCVVSAFPPPARLLTAGPETTLQTQAAQLQPNRHITNLTQIGLTVQWLLKRVADVQLSRDSSSLRPGNSCAFMSANKPTLAYVHHACVRV